MAKLKSDPITQSDLIAFLDGHSDFSFEIETLNALVALGFSCDHAGTYDDPATQKPREYDIRATRQMGKLFLRLAVECKNLRPHYPLLVSCLPRRPEEAFHELSYSVNPKTNPFEGFSLPDIIGTSPRSTNVRRTGENSIYAVGDPVGKSCDQVGRSEHDDQIVSGDSGVYAKWSQALSSAADLTCRAASDGEYRTGDIALSMVFALVVVPCGRLWQTLYDANGNRTSDPKPVDRCSYFVDRIYSHRSVRGGDELAISHLEFVTSNGLLKFVDDLCGDDAKVEASFPMTQIEELARFAYAT